MNTTLQDRQEAFGLLEQIATESAPPLTEEKRTLLRRVARDLIEASRDPSVPAGECPFTHGVPPPEPLTDRLAEVLWWMSRGLSNCEIAGKLGTSPETVNTQRDQIFRKLDVHSRYDASKWLTDRFYGWAALVLADWEWVGELLGGVV